MEEKISSQDLEITPAEGVSTDQETEEITEIELEEIAIDGICGVY